jgi:hypothetical protein
LDSFNFCRQSLLELSLMTTCWCLTNKLEYLNIGKHSKIDFLCSIWKKKYKSDEIFLLKFEHFVLFHFINLLL